MILEVNVAIRKFKATKQTLRGQVDIGGKSISLNRFKPKPSKYNPLKRPKQGITVEIRKGKKSLFNSSFYLPNGHIFVRSGKEKLPIKKLVGPRIEQMLDNYSKLEIRDGIESRLLTNFKHEMRLGVQFTK